MSYSTPIKLNANPARIHSRMWGLPRRSSLRLLLFTLGGMLDPLIHVTNGLEDVNANATANPVTNGLHLAAFVLDSFLLPISIVGMARLAMGGSRWLATIGGTLGLVGWVPFSALTA